MNEPSVLRVTAVKRAARAIGAAGLTVPGWEWRHPDLGASTGGGILAVAGVRAVARGAAGAGVTVVPGARFRRAAGTARAWLRGHGARYGDLRVVVVAVGLDGCARASAGSAAGAA